MSIFDDDQKAMLDVYLYETNSLFEQLDSILIEAEKTSCFTEADIHSIFRIMHTTKSSSSMMNLQDIAELMHTAEDIFSWFREHKEKANDQGQKTFDVLFAISDYMHKQLEQMKEESYQPDDAQALINQTKQLMEQIQTGSMETIHQDKEQHVSSGPSAGTYIRLIFEEGSRMENIRAYMIATQIKHYCTFLEYYPDKLENNPEAAKSIKAHGFYIHFVAEDPTRVLEQLHRALFVKKCEIIDKNDYHINIHINTEKNHDKQTKPADMPFEASSVIPIHVSKLDQLQNLTGELMINESMMRTLLQNADQKDLLQVFEQSFHKMFLEIEDIVMSMRLVPTARIIPKLNRVIRDICHKEQKEVTFVVQGEEIELDKEIVDHLFDPLMHLLRNAVDHGIEPKEERIALGKPANGTVTLQIKNDNGEIIITVEDDGCGLDYKRIKEKAIEKNLLTKPEQMYSESEIYEMILLPGLSTNTQANEFSGRGVGLDVVKNMLDRFKGHINIQSTQGKGTTFILHLPLTLTIVESILFCCGSISLSVPTHNVVRFFPFHDPDENIHEENGKMIYFYMGKALPVLHLQKIYHLTYDSPHEKIMIYLRSSDKEACIIVDNIIGYQHIVDKPLPQLLNNEFKKQTGITGCSLLGDGTICMTLNIDYLLNKYLS